MGRRFTFHLVDRQPSGSIISPWVRLEEFIAGTAHEPGIAGHDFRHMDLTIELAELLHCGGIRVGRRIHAYPVHEGVCEGLLHASHLL
jgi:hypothetical protein